MLSKKGAVSSQVTSKDLILFLNLCGECCPWALRGPTPGLCSREPSHWGGGDHTALETQPREMDFNLMQQMAAGIFFLPNLTIFLIMVISHLFLLKMVLQCGRTYQPS